MKQLITILFLVGAFTLNAQIVTLTPTNAGAEDETTLTFDATEGNGELIGATKVYLHHGVVLSSETGTDWNHVIGNWGKDDGIGEMSRVEGESDKWEITFSPSIREYFGVPEGKNIFRITSVFRSADGSVKGTIASGTYSWGDVVGGDFFFNLNMQDYVTITAPTEKEIYLNEGESFPVAAFASNSASSLSLWIDAGNGYNEIATVENATTISATFQPEKTTSLLLKARAVIDGEEYEEEKNVQVVVIKESTVKELPEGVVAGINYHNDDATRVTLVLEAPGKEYAYVVGDHSNWVIDDAYLMNQTPDGEYFWLELSDLEAERSYVFQYWVDGEVKIGDPYADQVADPWNDQYITDDVFAGIPDYELKDYGIATVFQTGQTNYEWAASETTWNRPEIDDLVIYELHVRDFIESHNYIDLIDTLTYLKRLGIDAIELMPVNEFEGNESWGYNPNYYFAPDKYYGTKKALKQFVEAAHQNGMAVILDMVLNHAFGSNPMVKLYWNSETGTPANDNPWFNEKYVGPYQWGYDFNHESDYTQRFVDRLNQYWLEEFHFDGFRFDFTKGLTNNAPGGSIDGFDQSRIDILKRMADEIWSVDNEAYIILEHWGPVNEETILGEYGMKMWKNRSYDFVPAVTGAASGSFSSLDAPYHVGYFNSHDERRIAEHALVEGQRHGAYDIRNPLLMMERMKMIAAFNFLQPGPKMMWQFDELGYDIDINLNGRTGNKPLPWGANGLNYYEDENRQQIYSAYSAILELRQQIGADQLRMATTNHKTTGSTRRLVFDTDNTDLVVIANLGLSSQSVSAEYTETGIWYDYFGGEEIVVGNENTSIELLPGEWHIYTSERLSEGMPGVVEFYDSPVTVTPADFKMSDEITITFDASKAWTNETDGLLAAENVYMTAGLVTDDPTALTYKKVIEGTSNESIGQMTKSGETSWTITIVPEMYFNTKEAFKMGMFFHDYSGDNVGMGFKNEWAYFYVLSDVSPISIDPPAFEANDLITITFDARQGNRELMGAEKVYMHSGVSFSAENPEINSWKNVIGNYGQDDGVGELTEVEEDIWAISLVPEEYYGFSGDDHPYWISCVFRDANGTLKGTADPGEYDFGFVAEGNDYFIKNQSKTNIEKPSLEAIQVYPNPTNGVLWFRNTEGDVTLYSTVGEVVFQQRIGSDGKMDISTLENGLYIYQINSDTKNQTGRILKK